MSDKEQGKVQLQSLDLPHSTDPHDIYVPAYIVTSTLYFMYDWAIGSRCWSFTSELHVRSYWDGYRHHNFIVLLHWKAILVSHSATLS